MPFSELFSSSECWQAFPWKLWAVKLLWSSGRCLLRKRHLEPQARIENRYPAGVVLLQSSHPDSSEKNQVFESQLHREVDEQSSPPLQLIHCTLEFEIWGRNGRKKIAVLFRSR